MGASLAAFAVFSLAWLGLAIDPLGPVPMVSASGLVLGAALLWGPRFCLLAVAIAAAFALDGAPPATVVGAAAGSAAGAWVAAAIFARAGRPALDRARAVLVFAIAVAAGGAVEATIAAAIGPGPWSLWWLSALASGVVLAPVLLATRGERPRVDPRAALELALVGAALVAGAAYVYARPAISPALTVTPIVVLARLWAAFRYRERGVALGTAIVTAIAVAGTARGLGPFAAPAAGEALAGLHQVQTFVSLTFLFGGAVLAERHAVMVALATSEARARFLAEVSAKLTALTDVQRALREVARHAVPAIARGCVIALETDAGLVKVAVATGDLEEERRLLQGTAAVSPALDAALERAAKEGVTSPPVLALRLAAGGHNFGALALLEPTPATDGALAAELAHRTTLALENARLYQEATRAVAARDDFLSIAGHELKTPLTALRLQVDGVVRAAADGPPAVITERAGRAIATIERITRLVEQLLDVSRIRAGRLLIDREDLDLTALVREVVERHSEGLARAGCVVSVAAPGPIAGRWDRARLEQLLSNLLTNAMKYGAGQPVDVVVSATEGRAKLVVRDHGAGIPPEDHQRIFERFERASAPKSYAGLGLGLWIAREIAGAHGGEIHVESAPGSGAAFVVELTR